MPAPSLSLSGKIWQKIRLYSLPEWCSGFVQFVEETPRRKDERLRAWMNRVLAGWQARSPHIQPPKAFLKVVLSKLEAERDPILSPRTKEDTAREIRVIALKFSSRKGELADRFESADIGEVGQTRSLLHGCRKCFGKILEMGL